MRARGIEIRGFRTIPQGDIPPRVIVHPPYPPPWRYHWGTVVQRLTLLPEGNLSTWIFTAMTFIVEAKRSWVKHILLGRA